MTPNQQNLVRTKAAWFEKFVEDHSNSKLDIQITHKTLAVPVTKLTEDEKSVFFPVIPIGIAGISDWRQNYDSLVITADYTGVNVNFRALTMGYMSLTPFKQGEGNWEYGSASITPQMKEFHTNLYVHEWCHQLEQHFVEAKFGAAFGMPQLHAPEAYGYGGEKDFTRLTGETCLAKWYADYLAGKVHAPTDGKSPALRGVKATWWQYTPLGKRRVG
jgi:hypothetical protein